MSIFKNKSSDNPEFLDSDLIINDDGSIYHLNLKPDQLADIVIAVGDPGRVYKVSDFFESIEHEIICREFVTHTGFYKGKRMSVISTGIGTDNIELFMNELDALKNIDFKTRCRKEEETSLTVVRIGTSGSLQDNIEIGSHLLSEYAIGLDNLMGFYDYQEDDFEKEIIQKLQEEFNFPFIPYCSKADEELLEKFKDQDMIKGVTLTTPGFYAPQGRKLRYNLRLPNMLTDLVRFHHENYWITNLEMETAGYYALSKLLGHKAISVNAIVANRMKNEFSTNVNKIIIPLIEKTLNVLVEE